MLDDVEQAPEGHIEWRARRLLHTEADGDRQMLFVCATRFGKYVEAGLGNFVMLRHHHIGEGTGRPDLLCSVGVMLTPNVSGNRPWETTLVRVPGPSGLTPEEVSEFGKLWPEDGNA